MSYPDLSSEGGKLGIIGLPFDENSSFLTGAAGAPPLIRAALFSEASNLWSENGTNLGDVSLIRDAGDVAAVAGVDLVFLIEESVRVLLDRKLRPIALGGDHAITYPVIRAIARSYAGLTVLDFDAHPDLYDEFQGSRRSHACPFARIMEEGLVRRLVQVGIRSMNGHQRRQAEKFGVEVIEMKDWRDLLLVLDSPMYISFDLDALDPAFAPGVSHREPGGLSVRQALRAIQTLDAVVVGADLVEFNPRMDAMNTTGVVCAKLLKEIAAKMLETA
ncbi:MAG: agmatinase [Acidobacteriia bacterium]|nr:agmatinase [Terriglobia bacterium]